MQFSRPAVIVLLLLTVVLQGGVVSTAWGDGVQSGITITRILTTKVASGLGSVSPNCPSGCSKTVGSLITVTASPSATWQFSKWTALGVSCVSGLTSSPCVFSMPNNPVTVSATFTRITKRITTTGLSCPISQFGGIPGTCTATISGGTSPTGTVTFTQSGYSFGVGFSGIGCTISGSGASQQAVCTVSSGSASVTVTGGFASGSVTITGTYSGDSANAGSSGTANITESDGG